MSHLPICQTSIHSLWLSEVLSGPPTSGIGDTPSSGNVPTVSSEVLFCSPGHCFYDSFLHYTILKFLEMTDLFSFSFFLSPFLPPSLSLSFPSFLPLKKNLGQLIQQGLYIYSCLHFLWYMSLKGVTYLTLKQLPLWQSFPYETPNSLASPSYNKTLHWVYSPPLCLTSTLVDMVWKTCTAILVSPITNLQQALKATCPSHHVPLDFSLLQNNFTTLTFLLEASSPRLQSQLMTSLSISLRKLRQSEETYTMHVFPYPLPSILLCGINDWSQGEPSLLCIMSHPFLLLSDTALAILPFSCIPNCHSVIYPIFTPYALPAGFHWLASFYNKTPLKRCS